jgi:serine phosphatase RsbU (regulator of sigma subunit)
MATAVCFDVDTRTRTLRVCGAGHPPTILLDLESGEATRLHTRSAPPLGIATPESFVDTSLELPPRWLLFAYTDGLIEQPRVSLDERIDALIERLAEQSPEDLASSVRRVANAMLSGGSRSDDVAILALVR